MNDETILTQLRIGLMTNAPETELCGGIKTTTANLRKAFPQLEIFPLIEWQHRSRLAKFNFKCWYYNWLKNDVAYSRFFLDEHKRKPFDIIFTNSCNGMFLRPKELKTAIINIYHTSFKTFINQTIKKIPERLLQKFIIGAMEKKGGKDKLGVTFSEKTRKEIRAEYEYNCVVIRAGVEIKNRVEKPNKFKNEKPLGLFVGHADYAKGWDILSDIAVAMPQVNFIAVVNENVSSYPANITVKKFMSSDELKKHYEVSDFFILPSRYESASYVTLEAMSYNLPIIISSEVGSAIFEADKPYGVHVANQTNDYLRAVESIISSNEPTETRSFVEKYYSLEQFCNKYRKLVIELL